eukprot:CAMPEP_0177660328 /NCGR_PEP_ID=MMETSP0447-20121125/17976_1 /TAXON_ID=0 /ORGANISM="Stygamoeba regulata, Strain BSH-02190019" /LENGTH=196 /DNA_ID=CAMNT_0019165375 /DNA_START=12 /DNA_END=602 /DNA_ORIENTATION=+
MAVTQTPHLLLVLLLSCVCACLAYTNCACCGVTRSYVLQHAADGGFDFVQTKECQNITHGADNAWSWRVGSRVVEFFWQQTNFQPLWRMVNVFEDKFHGDGQVALNYYYFSPTEPMAPFRCLQVPDLAHFVNYQRNGEIRWDHAVLGMGNSFFMLEAGLFVNLTSGEHGPIPPEAGSRLKALPFLSDADFVLTCNA